MFAKNWNKHFRRRIAQWMPYHLWLERRTDTHSFLSPSYRFAGIPIIIVSNPKINWMTFTESIKASTVSFSEKAIPLNGILRFNPLIDALGGDTHQ